MSKRAVPTPVDAPAAPPPGFGSAEWDAALATQRVVVVEPPALRRSPMPTPLAAIGWFLKLTARRLAATRSTAGGRAIWGRPEGR